MIAIDDAQCRRVAGRLDRVDVRLDAFAARAATPEERRGQANLLFYLVGICQSTRTLQGTVDGQWYRGWDYMVRAARRAQEANPEAFSAPRLAGITARELRAIFRTTVAPRRVPSTGSRNAWRNCTTPRGSCSPGIRAT